MILLIILHLFDFIMIFLFIDSSGAGLEWASPATGVVEIHDKRTHKEHRDVG